ncbi:MAG: RNA polymerase subunit sigma, partial [Solirubrobacterales bacterium]|nr:RNA polymerase subunit sigma [Solirubrobacterales bacterium]
MTIVHRRAVDRVRSEEAADQREIRAYREDTSYDQVSEVVEDRMQAERVHRCLDSLTDLQRDSVRLAYYRGYTYREVAGLLQVP